MIVHNIDKRECELLLQMLDEEDTVYIQDLLCAYKLAWIRGLKTTYYLRSLGATHVEKSTSDNSGSNLNAVKSDEEVKQCLIDDPECEACQ